jgi:hypothetical protein
MGIGAGYYLTSSIGAALALAILVLFRKFENLVLGGHSKPAIKGHFKTGQR